MPSWKSLVDNVVGNVIGNIVAAAVIASVWIIWAVVKSMPAPVTAVFAFGVFAFVFVTSLTIREFRRKRIKNSPTPPPVPVGGSERVEGSERRPAAASDTATHKASESFGLLARRAQEDIRRSLRGSRIFATPEVIPYKVKLENLYKEAESLFSTMQGIPPRTPRALRGGAFTPAEHQIRIRLEQAATDLVIWRDKTAATIDVESSYDKLSFLNCPTWAPHAAGTQEVLRCHMERLRALIQRLEQAP